MNFNFTWLKLKVRAEDIQPGFHRWRLSNGLEMLRVEWTGTGEFPFASKEARQCRYVVHLCLYTWIALSRFCVSCSLSDFGMFELAFRLDARKTGGEHLPEISLTDPEIVWFRLQRFCVCCHLALCSFKIACPKVPTQLLLSIASRCLI